MPYLYISLILRKLQTQRYACNRDPVDKQALCTCQNGAKEKCKKRQS